MTASEPKAESVATFGYGGCLTPGAVYATHIGTGQLSVSVDYGRELPIGDADAERLDGEIHVAVERALAPYWGELGRDTRAETLGRINYEAGLAKAREQGSNTLFDDWEHLEDRDRERCEAGALAVAAHVANPEAGDYNLTADHAELEDAYAAAHGRIAEVEDERDRYRELLDEIGVMAANAPGDGDSFGVLEQIAMRIAAVDVPDATPIDEWPDPDNPITGRTPGGAAGPEPRPALRMILGPCPVHAGMAHAQIGDDGEWFCLRDLADTAEAVGHGSPLAEPDILDFIDATVAQIGPEHIEEHLRETLCRAAEVNNGLPAVWSDACAPGGVVCAVPDPSRPDGICGNPVESGPCGEHEEPPDA